MANTPKAYLGTKTLVTFGTTTWVAHLQGVSWSGISRPAIDMSHMGSNTNVTYATNSVTFGTMEWVPGELTDAGEVSLDISFDPSQTPPLIEAPAETVTIVFPSMAVGTTVYGTASWAASMFATGYEWSGMKEERIEGRVTMKVAGVASMVTATS